MDEREEGWYWIKSLVGWEPAELYDGAWWVMGRAEPYEREWISEIGPRIERPQE